MLTKESGSCKRSHDNCRAQDGTCSELTQWLERLIEEKSKMETEQSAKGVS